MKSLRLYRPLSDEKGITIPLVAILITILVMFVAFAVDIGHLYVARNELQNAADAGALAGARELYMDNNATFVNEGANQVAYDAAVANHSEGVAVDVNLAGGNEGDVQRGHWSFASGTFRPNASLVAVDLWGVSTAELDADTDFINAVRVTARRQNTPVASLFAGIFGLDRFLMSAQAVAYIGFSGTQEPFTVDLPIALCEEALGDPYECTVGRFINSGNSPSTSESGGFTDLTECDGSSDGAANRPAIGQAVERGCSGGGANTTVIEFGQGIRMNNGQVQDAFTQLRNCWMSQTGGTEPWLVRLPVISCADGIDTCSTVVGAVEVRILWITEPGEGQVTAPESMGGWGEGDDLVHGWPGAEGNDAERWSSFVNHFKLQNLDGEPAPLAKKTIYLYPDCTDHDPEGLTGGRNFGILAEIPVLVD